MRENVRAEETTFEQGGEGGGRKKNCGDGAMFVRSREKDYRNDTVQSRNLCVNAGLGEVLRDSLLSF